MNKIGELAQVLERRIQWLCTITKTLNFKRKSYCAFTLSSNDNNKNYNFLDSNWFKKLLFSTNSLAKLLSDSLLSDSSTRQSHSNLLCKLTNHIQMYSLNQPIMTLDNLTWLFSLSRKLSFLCSIGNKTSCRPIGSIIILMINKYLLLVMIW